MASITIRNLDDGVKSALRIRAAERDRSMEEEARVILRVAVANDAAPEIGLGTTLCDLFSPFGGVELDLPPRKYVREPPRFD